VQEIEADHGRQHPLHEFEGAVEAGIVAAILDHGAGMGDGGAIAGEDAPDVCQCQSA